MRRSLLLERGFWIFLALTALIGSIYRSQMAGLDWGRLASLDWHRAHSHLGYYGVLFPATWIFLRDRGRRIPSAKILCVYYLIVVVSIVGFFANGYGRLATAGSFVVLLVWLFFAWQNRQLPGLSGGTEIDAVPLNICLAALCIPAIAFFSKRDPDLATGVVRAFMTILMLGVFVPSALSVSGARCRRPFLWTILPVGVAVDATHFSGSGFFRAGPLWYGLLIASTVWGVYRSDLSNFTRTLSAHWSLFAMGLIAQGLGVLPKSQSVVIAAVHFLVLGPLLLTLFQIRMPGVMPRRISLIYQVSLGLMVASILISGSRIDHYRAMQTIASLSGGVLFLCLAWVGFRSWVKSRCLESGAEILPCKQK